MNKEMLKELFVLDAEIGEFRWIKSPAKSVKAGDVAGCVDTYGYRVITVDGKRYKAHRLMWLHFNGVFPKQHIDHINGIPSDNSIKNLREVSHAENRMNSLMKISNKSGFKGVNLVKATGKWQAQCVADGKTHTLGSFNTPELASAAYEAFSKIHFGEFYRAPLEPKFGSYK